MLLCFCIKRPRLAAGKARWTFVLICCVHNKTATLIVTLESTEMKQIAYLKYSHKSDTAISF